MAALTPPFDASSHVALASKIAAGAPPRIPSAYSSRLFAFVRWMLTTNPADRPSADQVLKALRAHVPTAPPIGVGAFHPRVVGGDILEAPPDDAAERRVEGVGVVLRRDSEGRIVIAGVIPGGAAEESGAISAGGRGGGQFIATYFCSVFSVFFIF
jgi:hypothetical protein